MDQQVKRIMDVCNEALSEVMESWADEGT